MLPTGKEQVRCCQRPTSCVNSCASTAWPLGKGPARQSASSPYSFILAEVAEGIGRDRARAKTEQFERLLSEAGDGVGLPALSDMQTDPLERIKRWRMRAEELRTIADGFANASAQATLRRAATNYDQLADRTEAELKGSSPVVPDEAG